MKITQGKKLSILQKDQLAHSLPKPLSIALTTFYPHPVHTQTPCPAYENWILPLRGKQSQDAWDSHHLQTTKGVHNKYRIQKIS